MQTNILFRRKLPFSFLVVSTLLLTVLIAFGTTGSSAKIPADFPITGIGSASSNLKSEKTTNNLIETKRFSIIAGSIENSINKNDFGQTNKVSDTAPFFTAENLSPDSTFVVNNNNDTNDANTADNLCSDASGNCTLRAAVQQANALASNDVITFASALPTITLTLGTDIVVANNGSLQVNGPGANVLTIDGGAGTNRIFTSNGATLTISGLSLTGGNGNNNSGGAVFANLGNITLDGVYVFGNITSGSQGAGLHTQPGTNAVIKNSTFYGNVSGSCGAIANRGPLAMSNTTITGNSVNGNGQGGGLCVFSDPNYTVTLRNVTITSNSATLRGGGISIIAMLSVIATVDIGNSIIAGNSAPNSPEIYLGGGSNLTVTSAGNNLIGDSAGDAEDTGSPITYQATDIFNTPPVLAQFGFYGGSTPLHALQLGSPALDAGDNLKAIDPSNGSPLTTDQNGFARIVDGNHDGSTIVDIGAFEVQAVQQCLFSLNPTSQTVSPAGGNGSTNLITQSGCVWTAQSNVPWISITQGSSGSGSGTVSFSVEPNPGVQRVGTLTIGGETFTVIQADLVVTNLNDSGTGSLRQAITDAGNISGADTISFQNGLSGTILLTSGELLINSDVTINGSGSNADSLVVQRSAAQGTPKFRIFNIVAGTTASINNLTISGGFGLNSGAFGGGVYNAGTLTLNGIKVSNNNVGVDATSPMGANLGGGIYNTGILSLTNCTIEGNRGNNSSISGGGIANTNTGSLTITNTLVRGNLASGVNGLGTDAGSGLGGGLFNAGSAVITDSSLNNNSTTGRFCNGGGIYNSGTLTIIATTISQNSLTTTNSGECSGGGIYNGGSIDITGTTISSNSVRGGVSTSDGGGIFAAGPLNMINSTISGNQAIGYNNAANGRGGGIFGFGTFKNVTITGNASTGGQGSIGGGIYKVTNRVLTVTNTIVSNNSGANSAPNISGTVSSMGNNLISNTIGNSGWISSDILNQNAGLGPLGNYGGPTFTHSLLPGSLAINTGNNTNATATDQRGFPRVVGGIIDIGAFEASETLNTRTRFDFDGDGKADISVFRPSSGIWFTSTNPATNYGAIPFGAATDRIVPADYDGDGKTDVAVYRDGAWYLQRTANGFTGVAFGDVNDVPQPADFDGDGRAELAVYRPSNGTWYVYNLVNNQMNAVQFGVSEDKPVAADYDGDGRADYAVFRPSNGTWYLLGSQIGFTGAAFGQAGDKPVAADYDGDGKTDVAVFRPSNGVWYLLRSSLGFTGIAFGLGTDQPTPADYDGDGKADVAVFRNDTWYLQRSSLGFTSVAFGATNDKPIPNAFIP